MAAMKSDQWSVLLLCKLKVWMKRQGGQHGSGGMRRSLDPDRAAKRFLRGGTSAGRITGCIAV